MTVELIPPNGSHVQHRTSVRKAPWLWEMMVRRGRWDTYLGIRYVEAFVEHEMVVSPGTQGSEALSIRQFYVNAQTCLRDGIHKAMQSVIGGWEREGGRGSAHTEITRHSWSIQ